jgi:hypothetical protein
VSHGTNYCSNSRKVVYRDTQMVWPVCEMQSGVGLCIVWIWAAFPTFRTYMLPSSWPEFGWRMFMYMWPVREAPRRGVSGCSELGTRPGSELGTRPGSELGTRPGSELGTHSRSELGTLPFRTRHAARFRTRHTLPFRTRHAPGSELGALPFRTRRTPVQN